MRAAIYARYSSDLQREASIDDQVRKCRERIAREGWRLAVTYADPATSGANRLRPAYQDLLAGARSRRYDVLVAEASTGCRAIRRTWPPSTSASPSPASRS
jgi:DNA invertase Pin-like site-specific DNA recombinase